MEDNGNGGSAGVGATDASLPVDHRVGCADAFRLIRGAKAAFEARGCWRLAREIEDELARWESDLRTSLPLPFDEGERSGEGVDGEDSQAAEEVTAA